MYPVEGQAVLENGHDLVIGPPGLWVLKHMNYFKSVFCLFVSLVEGTDLGVGMGGGRGVNICLALLCYGTAELFKYRLVRPHFRKGWGGGKSQKGISNFCTFFGMELLWDDINHISKDRFG